MDTGTGCSGRRESLLAYYDDRWTRRREDPEAAKRLWDFRSDDFRKGRSSPGNEKRLAAVLDYLEEFGIPRPGNSVLDIGCGPGLFSAAFGRKGADVTGLDVSPEMLKRAEARAKEENLPNAVFRAGTWEETDLAASGWERRFDLVFASLCPGVNGAEGLRKMTAASRGFCFYGGFLRRSDPVREAAEAEVFGEDGTTDWGLGVRCAWNILWLRGHKPLVRYFDISWERRRPLEETVEMQALHLAARTPVDAALRARVAHKLEELSEGGFVLERVEAVQAWIVWRADETSHPFGKGRQS